MEVESSQGVWAAVVKKLDKRERGVRFALRLPNLAIFGDRFSKTGQGHKSLRVREMGVLSTFHRTTITTMSISL